MSSLYTGRDYIGIYLTKYNIWKEVTAANFSDEHSFSCDSTGLFRKKRNNISKKTVPSILSLKTKVACTSERGGSLIQSDSLSRGPKQIWEKIFQNLEKRIQVCLNVKGDHFQHRL